MSHTAIPIGLIYKRCLRLLNWNQAENKILLGSELDRGEEGGGTSESGWVFLLVAGLCCEYVLLLVIMWLFERKGDGRMVRMVLIDREGVGSLWMYEWVSSSGESSLSCGCLPD